MLKGPAKVLCLSFIVMFTISPAFARDYEVRRKVDGHTFHISINRNPPVVAKNDLVIEIRDPSGRQLTGLTVTVNYYMPPMPGMAPMNYTVAASPRGNGYRVVMDLIMTGPWNIVIRTTAGGKALRVTVPIDVR